MFEGVCLRTFFFPFSNLHTIHTHLHPTLHITYPNTGSGETQRLARKLLNALLPEISNKSFIVRDSSEMPKRSPRDLCVVHCSNRLVRLLSVMLERSLDTTTQLDNDFVEEDEEDIEEDVTTTPRSTFESSVLSETKESFPDSIQIDDERVLHLRKERWTMTLPKKRKHPLTIPEMIVRSSLLRPQQTGDEGHPLSLASATIPMLVTSPERRAQLCRMVATAIRAKSSHGVASEVARTFRLAAHKAWSRSSSSMSSPPSSPSDEKKNKKEDEFTASQILKTTGAWIAKCASLPAETHRFLRQNALWCLHFQQKILIKTRRLVYECKMTPETVLSAVYAIDLT